MKAELFSIDFVVSILLFLSVLVIVELYYSNLQSDIYEQYVLNDLQRKAISISDMLATSSGSPEFWDSTNVKVIGFFDSGRFNLTKFKELKKIDHQTVKKLMGTGVYNLNLNLKNETGNLIEIDGITYSFGLTMTNVKNAASIKRFGIADLESENKKVIMEVILWI